MPSPLVFASILALLAPSAPADDATVTFNKDIAPLVFRHCAACHRPGDVAPFSLLTYRDAGKRAELINEVVSGRAMPPWKPKPGHGDFANNRRLSDAEVDLVARWVKGGAAEGNAADLPPAPTFASGWQLGTPDLVLELPEPVEIPAEGRDLLLNLVFPLKVPAGKFLRAVEFRPGNRRVVHHAVLSSDTTGQARRRDEADPGPGFHAVSPTGRLLPGSLAIWTPGRTPLPLPDGMAMAWPDKADLVVQLHLHPVGKPETERSSIGLFFTDEAPKRTLVDAILMDRKIDIPPGESAYHTRASRVLPADMDAVAVFPHMHWLGKDIKVTATLPDGTVTPLIWIDDWDFNWQDLYVFSRPVRLPKGTTLAVDAVHDNSPDNPRNPTKPPVRVRFGEQTTNEMTIAFVTLAPVSDSDPKAAAPAQPGDHMAALLRMLDADRDGSLSLPEILASSADPDRRAELEKRFAQFDRDNNNRLDRTELAEALKSLVKP